MRAVGVATCLRAGIALLCLVVAAAEGHLAFAAPWVLLVTVLEVLADQWPRARAALLVAQVVAVMAALVVTLPTTRVLLPLLLVPAFRAGEEHRRRTTLAVCLALAGGLAVAWFASWRETGPAATMAAAMVQWWLLAAGLAFLAAWNRRVEADRRQPDRALAREAGELLGRLTDVAQALPAGLDAPAVAELMLDGVLAGAPADRSAVLVQVGADQISPVAVRGVERVPWRNPVSADGTAHLAWTGRRVVSDVRPHEDQGRRAGSALLCVPVADREDELLGLVLLERMSETPFTAEETAQVVGTVNRLAPHLHAALAYTGLRHVTEMTERERLAREMHDGVAQDLSALGFSLDVLAREARRVDEGLTGQVRDVRAQLNRTIRDIRLSIADLRSSHSPDRGLGAALSSHVQALAASTGIAVTLSLQESSFRLHSHVESALLRLAHDFLVDARTQADDVRRVAVTLESDAPEATLVLVREGGRPWHPDETLVADLRSRGGSLDPVHDSDPVHAVLRVEATSQSQWRPDRHTQKATAEVGP